MSSPVYAMLCAIFVFVIGVVAGFAGYEYRGQFKMMANVDAAEKPEEYRSLRDYASPGIRSHSTSPAFVDPYLSARHPFGSSSLSPEAALLGDQHSYSSQKSFFVNRQLVSFNPAVEKKTPHWMKMSALDKPYPFYMPKPYSLIAATMEKPPGGNVYPPVAVKMYATAFLPIKSDKQMNLPFFVSKPTSSYVDTGPKDRYVFGQASPEKLPATGHKMLPEQQYEKRAPEPAYGYNTIMESKYPIYAPPHQKLIPLPVEKLYPLQYQIEKPIPGYPMYQMEKGLSHPVAGLPVPIRIPIDLPAAVPVDEPLFIPVEEPRASASTNQHSLAFNFKPQLFMSTALLRQLAAAQSNASSSAQRLQPVTSSRAAASSRPLADETEDIEPEGTDNVNEYESLRTAVGVNGTMATTTTTVTPMTTASTTTITMSTASSSSVSPEVNTTTADTLSSTPLPSSSTLNP